MKLQLPSTLIFLSLTIYLTFSHHSINAQTKLSKYGVEYIGDISTYEKLILNHSDFLLLDIHRKIPNAKYDLRYASKNNFTNKILYPSKTKYSFLVSGALEALSKAAKEFDALGYDLVIYDAYRPYSVTVQFWELIQNEDYVAKPTKGSMHNRGLAVDLTLWDRSNNQYVDMGTDFDHFTEEASHAYQNLSSSVLANRKVLKSIMEAAGFKPLASEWWHYIWDTPSEHPVLDIPFKKLYKVQEKSNK